MGKAEATGQATTTGASTRRGGAGRFFIRGLGVVLPSILTLWILVTAFRFIATTSRGRSTPDFGWA